eukprot:4207371-Prorocentrum_lima.AAC.1
MPPPPVPERSKTQQRHVSVPTIGEQAEITYGAQRPEPPRATTRGRTTRRGRSSDRELPGAPATSDT